MSKAGARGCRASPGRRRTTNIGSGEGETDVPRLVFESSFDDLLIWIVFFLLAKISDLDLVCRKNNLAAKKSRDARRVRFTPPHIIGSSE